MFNIPGFYVLLFRAVPFEKWEGREARVSYPLPPYDVFIFDPDPPPPAEIFGLLPVPPQLFKWNSPYTYIEMAHLVI